MRFRLIHEAPDAYGDFDRLVGLCGELPRATASGGGHLICLEQGVLSDALVELGATRRRAAGLGNASIQVLDSHARVLVEYDLGPTEPVFVHGHAGARVDELILLAAALRPAPPGSPSIWRQWSTSPPSAMNAWHSLDHGQRRAWLDIVRRRGGSSSTHAPPPDGPIILDGQFATDYPGIFLALGEAAQGPGGYYGGDPESLADCLCGGYGPRAPFALHWTHSAVARIHLTEAAWRKELLLSSTDLTIQPDEPGSLFDAILATLERRGVEVVLG
jgi:hypothetical protein